MVIGNYCRVGLGDGQSTAVDAVSLQWSVCETSRPVWEYAAATSHCP